MVSLIEKFNRLGFKDSKPLYARRPLREIEPTSNGQRRFQIKRQFRDADLNSMQEEPPPFESLPEDLQNELNKIANLPPLEKLRAVHHLTNSIMRYDKADARKDQSKGFSIKYVLERGLHGDCDDFASLESGLLQYVGFKKQHIHWFGNLVQYTNEGYGGHAGVIVEVSGQHYYLDMNIEDPVLYDENAPMVGKIAPVKGIDGSILNKNEAGQIVTLQVDPALIVNLNRNFPSSYFEGAMKKVADGKIPDTFLPKPSPSQLPIAP